MPQTNKHDLFPSDSDELSDCGVFTDSSWSDTLKLTAQLTHAILELIVRAERKRKSQPTPKDSADAETLHNATAKTKSDSTAKVTAVKPKTTTAKAAAAMPKTTKGKTTEGKRKKVKNEENRFEKEYDKWAIRYDYDVMIFMSEFKKHHPSHQLPQALDQFVKTWAAAHPRPQREAQVQQAARETKIPQDNVAVAEEPQAIVTELAAAFALIQKAEADSSSD
ncbi:hypothetical protein HDU90_003359 [Geranomyces variabilis]|nr:hypothetical protein HDU90_003359 [Geranomyces variabilis]